MAKKPEELLNITPTFLKEQKGQVYSYVPKTFETEGDRVAKVTPTGETEFYRVGETGLEQITDPAEIEKARGTDIWLDELSGMGIGETPEEKYKYFKPEATVMAQKHFGWGEFAPAQTPTDIAFAKYREQGMSVSDALGAAEKEVMGASAQVAPTNQWINQAGQTIDPSKYTNLKGQDLIDWATQQGYKPIDKTAKVAGEGDNLRKLGPAEFGNLVDDWEKAGLTYNEMEEYFLERDEESEDIFLKTDAPSSEQVLGLRDTNLKKLGPIEWEGLQEDWKAEGLTPKEIEENFIERKNGDIYLREDAPSSESIIKGREKATEEIPAITPSTDLHLAMLESPNLPDVPDPIVTMNNYAEGLTAEVASKKQALEDYYTKQLDTANKQIESIQKQIDALSEKQEGIITEDIKELRQPWREKLEKEERKRLKIEENYFANQNSIQELETLLNQAISDIKTAEQTTGLKSIRIPRINKIKEDYQGRVGVIEAVMAARNNQINQGYTLIDRMSNAITQDKQSLINYYDSLYKWYDGLKGEAKDLLEEAKEEKKEALASKLSILVGELDEVEETNATIKKLMIDPESANMIEQAGISLNDTVETINYKMSQYHYQQELIEQKHVMEEKGYKYLSSPEQLHGLTEKDIARKTDSRGVERIYKVPEGEDLDEPLSASEAATLGVPYGTTKREAIKMGITPARWKGTGGEGDATLTTDEKAFYADIDTMLNDLNSGKRSWGEAFNYIKSKWGAPDDIIDNLLNKEVWGEEGAYEKRKAAREEEEEEEEPVITDVLNQYKIQGYSKSDIKNLVRAEYGFLPDVVKDWLKQNY